MKDKDRFIRKEYETITESESETETGIKSMRAYGSLRIRERLAERFSTYSTSDIVII